MSDFDTENNQIDYEKDIQAVEYLNKMGKLSDDEAQEYLTMINNKKNTVKNNDTEAQNEFDTPEKIEVFEYLKSIHGEVPQEVVSKVSGFIKNIENSASLRADSLDPRTRLGCSTAARNSQKASCERTFSLEEIKKMPADEYLKNEKAIFKQMAEGKLKRS